MIACCIKACILFSINSAFSDVYKLPILWELMQSLPSLMLGFLLMGPNKEMSLGYVDHVNIWFSLLHGAVWTEVFESDFKPLM